MMCVYCVTIWYGCAMPWSFTPYTLPLVACAVCYYMYCVLLYIVVCGQVTGLSVASEVVGLPEGDPVVDISAGHRHVLACTGSYDK